MPSLINKKDGLKSYKKNKVMKYLKALLLGVVVTVFTFGNAMAQTSKPHHHWHHHYHRAGRWRNHRPKK
jgi:hypothetical protein